MARKKKGKTSKEETIEKRIEKMKKRSENRRKRLIRKRDLELARIEKARTAEDQKEDLEIEKKIIENFKNAMKECDEEIREFYPDPEEWEKYSETQKAEIEAYSQMRMKNLNRRSKRIQQRVMLENEGADAEDSETDNEETEGDKSQEGQESEEDERIIRGRRLLEEHIAAANESKKKMDTETIDMNQDDNDSDTTARTGKNVRGGVKKTQQPIPGYTRPTAKKVIFCKIKVVIKQNDSPTSNMIKAFSAFLTTLLKVDKTLLLYKYKDSSNTSFINRPTAIPSVPSKIKNFFHGKYRPRQDAHQLWPEIKIGINMDEESFFEDAKCLLNDKGIGMIFKKDLQAEETQEIGFFLFSNLFQDRKRQCETLRKVIKKEFKFEPRLNL